MQRYFVKRNHVNETSIRIMGDDAIISSRVMRMSAGDQLLCVNR